MADIENFTALAVRHSVAFLHGGLCFEFIEQFREKNGNLSGEQLVQAINLAYRKELNIAKKNFTDRIEREKLSADKGSKKRKGMGEEPSAEKTKNCPGDCTPAEHQKRESLVDNMMAPTNCRRGCVLHNFKECQGDISVDHKALEALGCTAMVVGHTVAQSDSALPPFVHMRRSKLYNIGIMMNQVAQLEPDEEIKLGGENTWFQFLMDTGMSRAFPPHPTGRLYTSLEVTHKEGVTTAKVLSAFIEENQTLYESTIQNN